MKWPSHITLVRHGQSAYNELRQRKESSLVFQRFKKVYEEKSQSGEALQLARTIQRLFSLGVGDYETPLTPTGGGQARLTGSGMRNSDHPLPDVIFVSPYLRTRQTLEEMIVGWPELAGIPVVSDDRIREQEHGLSLIYNDWRVFHTLHPEQRELRELLGPYWYQYPQGESVSQVRDRIRSFTGMLMREHANERVLVVTHHLTILSIRANYERLTPEEFIHLDENEKPRNCGVTVYEGDPDSGRDGKLRLKSYNQCFWQQGVSDVL